MGRRIAWLLLFAVAMAYVESAVVVYLREIANSGGMTFPIVVIPAPLVGIEIGREAATILMLVGLAVLAGGDVWERFLFFCMAFAVWDVLYYVWLRVFIGWPQSLLTWDILFLIPVPWIAPVATPLIVATTMIAGSAWLLRLKGRGVRLGFPPALWIAALAGGLVVILSFTIDAETAFHTGKPEPFRWWLFALGWLTAAGSLVRGVRKLPRAEAV